MAEFVLTARPRLEGLDRRIGAGRLAAVTDMTLTALAVPRGGSPEPVLTRETGLTLPAPGHSVVRDTARLIWSGPEQYLLAMPGAAPEGLATAFYLTEQTDAWAILELSGTCQPVLERLTMLDVAKVPESGARRTLVAHLSVLLVKLGPERWWLMSAGSSAKSFAASVETAMRAVA